MGSPRPFSILELACGADAAELLRIANVENRLTSIEDPEAAIGQAREHDLVVISERSHAKPAELAARIRSVAPETLIALLRPNATGVTAHPDRYDDILVRSRTREISRRLGDLVRIGRMRRRFRASALAIGTVRSALDDLGLSGSLVDEGGILPPCRLRLASQSE